MLSAYYTTAGLRDHWPSQPTTVCVGRIHKHYQLLSNYAYHHPSLYFIHCLYLSNYAYHHTVCICQTTRIIIHRYTSYTVCIFFNSELSSTPYYSRNNNNAWKRNAVIAASILMQQASAATVTVHIITQLVTRHVVHVGSQNYNQCI